MRANVWSGRNTVQVENVPDPQILNGGDAIVKISSTAICGSDLHLYDGYIPTMEHGDILGHEFMGEIVETGSTVTRLKVGDRVVVPFPISCGKCEQCLNGLFSVCENTNPNAGMAEKVVGHPTAGIFGYSHLTGATRMVRPSTRACPTPTWADQDRRGPRGRAGAVPLGHLPDRVHGCRDGRAVA
jgi:threonine dehydrogenase-like Zn-dependent dehydrogenase